MTIFANAYDTTVGKSRSQAIAKTIVEIEKSIIVDGLDGRSLNLRTDLDYIPLVIAGAYKSESFIPAFIHPVVFTASTGKKVVAIDMRSCFRADLLERDGTFVVRNHMLFDFTYQRLLNNLLMVTQPISFFEDTSLIPSLIFGDLISEQISRRFALNPREQGQIKIISQVYFNSLFKENFELNQSERDFLAGGISRQNKLPSALCFETVEKIQRFSGIESLCSSIVEIVDNPSVKANLNAGLLVTLLASVWQGDAKVEMPAVGCEHLPTWYAMVLMGMTERGFRSCKLADVALRYAAKDNGTRFAQELMSYQEHQLFANKLEF